MAMGCPLVEPLVEVLARQELGDGELAGQPDDIGQVELAEPLALPSDLGLFFIDYLEELLHIGLGVGLDLFGGEHRAGDRTPAGVADLRRPVAHDEDNLVPQLLELAQLAQRHHVPQVDIGRAGVEALL